MCVTADGTLWSWGENVFNQLGLKYQSDRFVPSLVAETLNGKPGQSHRCLLVCMTHAVQQLMAQFFRGGMVIVGN